MSAAPPAAPPEPASAVDPAYGPDLPSTLGAWLGWRRRTAGAVLVGVLVVLVAAGFGLRAAFAHPRISRSAAPAFGFSYGGRLHPVAPVPGGFARVESRAAGRLLESFAVRPLRLPAYRGNVTALLVVWAASRAGGGDPGLRDVHVVDEGRARVGGKAGTQSGLPAYTLGYTARLDGHRVYGRDMLLLAGPPGTRRGIQVTMLRSTAAQARSADDVPGKGSLLDALNSLSVG